MELQFSKKKIFLNNEQYKAVVRPLDVNQRIIASAGSGKTTTLTARIAYLIEQCSIESNRIVLLTFSRNSAIQMKGKLYEMIGENEVYAGTFHGLSKNLLQKYNTQKVKTLYFIDELVSMGDEWLQTTNGRKWVGRLRYIFVDEFQDINASQWRMISHMLHPNARLVVVGDDCQNIYTWRGSDVRFILELQKEVKHLVDDQLFINYRSSDNIIQVANSVMKNIPTLPWKTSMKSYRQKFEKPHIHFFYRVIDETHWIVKNIMKKLEENPKTSIAIISRMNQDLYRFEEEFVLKGLSYRLHDIGTCIETANQKSNIDLLTVHSSKGLEWDVVYLIHCNDDIFPSSKKKEEIINERRLFYVAITRAREELYFSYTNDERCLSRFIREVPNTLLTYHGLAKYMLSEYELGKTRKRLVDILGCLSSEDLSELRKKKLLDWFNTENLQVKSLYPSDLFWKRPNWIQNETLPDFQRFLNIWLKRHFCSVSKISYRDPSSEKLIFTLRIFSEDLEFFNENREHITKLVHMNYELSEQKKDPPVQDYPMLEQYAKENNIMWNSKELVTVTGILGKIRGQLRPLRFYNYDIKEFNIGYSRFVVPIQWRGEVLESWRRVSDPSLLWEDCLEDIWRIGALSLVSEGRNVAMYRTSRMKEHLKDSEFIDFLKCVERYTSIWMCEDPCLCSSILVEDENEISEIIDLQTTNGFYSIGGLLFNSFDLLRLAIASTFNNEGVNIKTVGIFIPLDGKLFSFNLPKDIRIIAKTILNIALSKT
jgi:hypothetical protein